MHYRTWLATIYIWVPWGWTFDIIFEFVEIEPFDVFYIMHKYYKPRAGSNISLHYNADLDHFLTFL